MKKWFILCCIGWQQWGFPVEKAYIAGGSGEYSVVDTATQTVSFQTPVGSNPICIAVDPAGTKAFLADFSGSSTHIFDATTNAFITTIPAPPGTNPLFVAVAPDGALAYVVNFKNLLAPSSITVLDVNTNSVVGSPINVGHHSQMIAITPDSAKMYVPNYLLHTVSVIVGNVASSIAVGLRPIHLAITPNGAKVYVANYFGDSVSVIDTGTDTVLTAVPLPGGSSPQFIGINPSGTEAYVANWDGSNVTVIDTTADTIITNIPLPPSSSPMYIVFTPDGTQAYVADFGGNAVSIIDTSSHSVITTVGVGNGPVNLAVTPDGQSVYVANQSSAFISIIDTTTHNVTSLAGLQSTNWIAMGPASLLPPRQLQGYQARNRFLTQTDIVNVISWTAPEDIQDVIGYNLYRDSALTDLISFVDGTVFEDHNRKKGKTYTYYVTTVYANGGESSAHVVTVRP